MLAEAEAEAEAAEGAARSCRKVGETPAPPNAAGAEELDMEREDPARRMRGSVGGGTPATRPQPRELGGQARPPRNLGERFKLSNERAK